MEMQYIGDRRVKFCVIAIPYFPYLNTKFTQLIIKYYELNTFKSQLIIPSCQQDAFQVSLYLQMVLWGIKEVQTR